MNFNISGGNIPKSLLTYSRQSSIVVAMAVIAMVFMAVFRPFGIYESLDFLTTGQFAKWINTRDDAFYAASLFMMTIALVCIWSSRMIMVHASHKKLTYKGYFVWCLIEFILVAFVITFCSSGLFHQSHNGLLRLFITVMGRASCILFIPYAFCWLYIIIVDKAQQLRALHESIENEENALQKSFVILCDDHDEMRLSIKREDLIMIESADNYICVWYLNNTNVKKCMIRNTLKRVASQLEDTSIQRCHRSYMINTDLIKVLRRDKDGIFIEFGIEGVFDIPISRTYLRNITTWLMR